MNFKLPDSSELKRLAAELNLTLDDTRAAALLEYMQPIAEGYEFIDSVEDELPVSPWTGRDYYYPETGENPYGAWLVKCRIKGVASGPLTGKKVAVKDNIFVAGLPLTNGSDIMSGFVADFDATVVDRLLNAGAEIAGKTACEYLCLSGGSATSAAGIVQNPRKPGYSTGGSSSGSAALVAAGEVDMALGTDQGGSVRIPACWTGVVGMKATRGVVPFSGGIPIEASIEYIGPLTSTVADNALFLEVMADDGTGPGPDYSSTLGQTPADLRIAVVKEGFGWPSSAAAVDQCVKSAAAHFASLGATVEEISIPGHSTGPAIWGGIVTDGLWQTLKLNGVGFNHEDIYSPALYAAMRDWTRRISDMPINAALILLLGRYLEKYHGRYYARSKNLARKLRASYDKPLQEYDLLLMPTLVDTAAENPGSLAHAGDDRIMQTAFGNTLNTCQFNATGHPAISIPCGQVDGLPVGLMLVGRHHAEQTVYRAAHAFEQSTDWQNLEF